jgi:hypothetical protein
MEAVALLVAAVLALLVLLGQVMHRQTELLINGIVGLILLLATGFVLGYSLPVNFLTIALCAVGGIIGWLIVLVLYFLGVFI